MIMLHLICSLKKKLILNTDTVEFLHPSEQFIVLLSFISANVLFKIRASFPLS